MKTLNVLFVIIALSFVSFSFAAECDSTTKVAKDFSFPATFKASQLLSKELCLIASDVNSDFSAVEPVANAWRKAALREANELKSADVNVDSHIQTLYDGILDGLPFKNFEVDKTDYVTYSVSGSDLKVVAVDSACNSLSFQKNCYDLLAQLQVALNTTYDAINAVETTKVFNTIGLYSKQWDNYFDKARSQTFIELSLNTWLYSDELKKNEFVVPPSYQLIVLHPSIVLEYVANAVDGDQEKEAFAMEWIGVNWWNAKVPLGFSLVTTHSDRASVDNFGYGVMLHINNNYSIGVTDHDGDTGVLVTIDLLKLFETKQKNLKSFKSEAQKYL